MNYWQGKSVRLRSIEPDDGPFLFELSKDFNFLRYQKCSIGVYSFNTVSARFHESLGFVQEGCTRRAAYVAGRFYDCFAYGMTAEEFRARHGEFPSLDAKPKRKTGRGVGP